METYTEEILSEDANQIAMGYLKEGRKIPHISIDTFLNNRVPLGGGDGKGRENPDTRIYINGCGIDQDGQFRVFSIGLTVPQMAGIVKEFFWDTCSTSKFFRKVLLRLFGKRWSLMTSDCAKFSHDDPVFGEWSKKMVYHKDLSH